MKNTQRKKTGTKMALNREHKQYQKGKNDLSFFN